MSKKQKFYENQYRAGETKGPWWYQLLTPLIKTREDVAFDIISMYEGKKHAYLDLGCGEGDLIARLENEFKVLVGSDIAKNRLKLAKKKYKSKKISFQFADLDKTFPYKDSSFDVVTCLGVIEYTFDPYHIMKEAHRIIKPGGILILEVPNIAFLPERLKLLFGLLPSWPDAYGWQGSRLHNFTCGSLYRLGNESSFEVIKMTGAGFLQPLRALWPSLLSGDCIVVYRK